MKKKLIAYTFAGSYFNHQYVFKELIVNLKKEFEYYIFIDLSYLIHDIKDNFKFEDKNFFIPRSYRELEKFLLENEIVSFISLGKEFEYFKALRLYKKCNVKLILNMSIGVSKKLKIFNKKKLLKKGLSFMIFRFLVLINYLPRIDLLFESSKENILNINKQIGRKIKNYFPVIDISYIKEIEHINCRAYDSYIDKLDNISEQFIVFLDGGFDHPDVEKHGKKQSLENREKYYFLLNKILEKLSRFYKKEIIFCVHPKVDENQIKTFFDNEKVKIMKYQTQYFILRAFLVVMHESSTTFDALILKKRVMNLNSKIMGNFYYERNKFYPKRISIPSYTMEDYERIEKSDIDKYFLDRINLYDNYLKNFVRSLSNYKKFFFTKTKDINDNKFNDLPGSIQMLRIIKKKFF